MRQKKKRKRPISHTNIKLSSDTAGSVITCVQKISTFYPYVSTFVSLFERTNPYYYDLQPCTPVKFLLYVSLDHWCRRDYQFDVTQDLLISSPSWCTPWLWLIGRENSCLEFPSLGFMGRFRIPSRWAPKSLLFVHRRIRRQYPYPPLPWSIVRRTPSTSPMSPLHDVETSTVQRSYNRMVSFISTSYVVTYVVKNFNFGRWQGPYHCTRQKSDVVTGIQSTFTHLCLYVKPKMFDGLLEVMNLCL